MKRTLLHATCILSWCGATASAEPARPNVIVILADDMGWSDLGVQGVMKDCKTPNLDALATSGVRCTAGYIPSPQCSPSRAAIITGCFQQHFGIDTTPDVPLPAEATKLAARLGPAGYRCGFVGKWTPQFQPPGIPEKSDNPQEEKWYQYYFQAQQQ